MSTTSLPELTEGTTDGSGVFDVLMASVKAHLEQEFQKSRLRGPEYAEVYLGSLQAVMSQSLQFLLAKEKAELEADLLREQIATQIKQTSLLQAQEDKLAADIDLGAQQILSEVQNTDLITAQKCKLDAEYDVLMLNKDKVTAETGLLAQKKATERAQTVELGVDVGSVIGKQKTLYERQADGFTRDAEQKAAKTLIDTWNVRRTTDTGTVADSTNMLDDATVGRVVNTLLSGVNA